MAIILFKLVLALGLTALIVFLVSFRDCIINDRLMRHPWIILLFGFLLRLVPYAGIYLLYGLYPRSDVASHYWPEALGAFEGKIIYREFESHYGPLFPYLLSVSLLFWKDPRAIVLLMLLMELVALFFTFSFFSRRMDRSDCAYASLLYLLMPGPLIFVLFGGQEDIWMWTFGALIGALLLGGQSFYAGLLAGVGLIATKALFVLAIIPALFAARRPFAFFAGLAIIGGMALPTLWILAGNGIFMPLRESVIVSPPNIWIAINAISGGWVPLGNPYLSITSLVIVAVLGCIFFCVYRLRICGSFEGYCAGWIFLFSSLLLLSPKSHGDYTMIFLMPLTFLVVLHKDLYAACLTLGLSFLVSVQPSLWSRLGSPSHTNFSFFRSFPELAEFAMELVMLAIFIALMHRTWLWVASLAPNGRLNYS